jgi:hypothetical protein
MRFFATTCARMTLKDFLVQTAVAIALLFGGASAWSLAGDPESDEPTPLPWSPGSSVSSTPS